MYRRPIVTSVSSVFEWLSKAGLWDAAWRENRRRARAEKSALKRTTYQRAGLNGLQAMERRRRQIAAGQITEANGLVRT